MWVGSFLKAVSLAVAKPQFRYVFEIKPKSSKMIIEIGLSRDKLIGMEC